MVLLRKELFHQYSLRNRTMFLLREHTQVLPYRGELCVKKQSLGLGKGRG